MEKSNNEIENFYLSLFNSQEKETLNNKIKVLEFKNRNKDNKEIQEDLNNFDFSEKN